MMKLVESVPISFEIVCRFGTQNLYYKGCTNVRCEKKGFHAQTNGFPSSNHLLFAKTTDILSPTAQYIHVQQFWAACLCLNLLPWLLHPPFLISAQSSHHWTELCSWIIQHIVQGQNCTLHGMAVWQPQVLSKWRLYTNDGRVTWWRCKKKAESTGTKSAVPTHQ